MSDQEEDGEPQQPEVNIQKQQQSKRRRLHMDPLDIDRYEATAQGSAPLTNPQTVPKSSRDVNQGLYPRESRKRRKNGCDDTVDTADVSVAMANPERFGLSVGFQSAGSVMNVATAGVAQLAGPSNAIPRSPKKSPSKSKSRSPLKKAEGL